MTTEPQEPEHDRIAVNPSPESHFGWLRTRLALERTLMAWVRTAVSLIGFGFTIVQFFERLGGMTNVRPSLMPEAPRYLGLAMIGAGILSLLISVWQFNRTLNYLRNDPFVAIANLGEPPTHTPIYFVSIVLALIGTFAFVAVLMRAL
jgi:putative membrane protein